MPLERVSLKNTIRTRVIWTSGVEQKISVPTKQSSIFEIQIDSNVFFFLLESYWNNPQFVIDLEKETGMSKTIVSLMEIMERNKTRMDIFTGFDVYKVSDIY